MKNRNQRFFRDCGIHRGHCSAPRLPSEGEGPGSSLGVPLWYGFKRENPPGRAAERSCAAGPEDFSKRMYKNTKSSPPGSHVGNNCPGGEKR
ncbi:hypothetical protein D7Y41_34780 [Anaerotruncus sp. 1XD22-93]|nr:hypothetical protein D7Y41_34780 [Anaerotruncus sp. 1XD22-93]